MSTTSTIKTTTATIKTTTSSAAITSTAATTPTKTSSPEPVVILQDHSGDGQANIMPVSTACNALETSWTCSNGNKNLSLCAHFCFDGDTMEYKRCVCRENTCDWTLKGEACPVETSNDMDISELTTLPGNFSISANSGDLMSAIREMHLTNNGVMNVSFNLK